MYVHREHLSLTSVPLRRLIVSFSFSSFAWFFCQCFVSAALSFCFFFFFLCFSVSGVGPLRSRTVLFLLPSSVCCCFIVVVDGLFLFFVLSSAFLCFSLPLLSYCPLLGQVLAHCRSCFVFSLLQAVDVGRFHRRAHVVHVPGGSRSAGLGYALYALNSLQCLFFYFYFVFLFLRCFLYPCCMVFLSTGVHFRRMRFNALGTLVSLVVTRASNGFLHACSSHCDGVVP